MDNKGKNSIYAVIMAGGVGARFWPRSTERTPKQLLEVLGKGTMIQNTVYRLDPLVARENILVITNKVQVDEVRRQLPQIPVENIVVEPVGKNTAPCIALAAEILLTRDPDAMMIALPADHLVHDIVAFQETMERAVQVAKATDSLVTIGISPTRPETGYGYIQYDADSKETPTIEFQAYPVKTFAEKPNQETAMRFLESKDFVWNSGIFVWKATVIREVIRELLPELYEELQSIHDVVGTKEFDSAIRKAYAGIPSISIDYGVMEKAENTYVIRGDFGWSDLGSWDEVCVLSPKDEQGNSLTDNTIALDSRNCHVETYDDRLVAIIGIEDCIIIDSDKATLICRVGKTQRVKEIVDFLRRKRRDEYL